MTRISQASLISLAVILVASPALAHSGEGISGGFASGFLHPFMGWDHALAMISVGLWAAFLGMPATWLLPVVFPLVMVVGGIIGMGGISLPLVEVGIAVSLVLLGALIAAPLRAPVWLAAIAVGAFAVCHGHAHGAELPAAASPIAYAVGFVIATGLLHVVGISLGALARFDRGKWAIRGGGVGIALTGLLFLVR